MGVEGGPLRDRVVFVEGAPRSGTTWLTMLLVTHPEIAGVAAEAHLFDRGVDALFDNLESTDPMFSFLANFVSRAELVDTVRDLCDGVLSRMRARVKPGATFVLEKTPVAAARPAVDMARKLECYPDGWYLHIVRDGDAVARSLMRAPFAEDRSFAACHRRWEEAVDAIRNIAGGHPRYREMRYEDLKADPVAQVRSITNTTARSSDSLYAVKLSIV